jgi:4-hydroxy-4-methyl-2-oxoglutarate aldolase
VNQKLGSISNSIIEYCRSNRISTTETADALEKSGVVAKCKPLNFNHYAVGQVYPVFTSNGSNFELHEQVRDVPKNHIVMIFTYNCEDLAVIGELVSKFILLYRGAAAIVVNGLVRDYSRLRRDNYPIWCEGWTPLGCMNQEPTDKFPIHLEKQLREQFDGAIAVCDDGGVTVIEKSKVNLDTLEQLRKMEIQEDIWAFCLNTLKWDTKRIVCDKDYLEDSNLFSKAQQDSLNKLRNRD